MPVPTNEELETIRAFPDLYSVVEPGMYNAWNDYRLRVRQINNRYGAHPMTGDPRPLPKEVPSREEMRRDLMQRRRELRVETERRIQLGTITTPWRSRFTFEDFKKAKVNSLSSREMRAAEEIFVQWNITKARMANKGNTDNWCTSDWGINLCREEEKRKEAERKKNTGEDWEESYDKNNPVPKPANKLNE